MPGKLRTRLVLMGFLAGVLMVTPMACTPAAPAPSNVVRTEQPQMPVSISGSAPADIIVYASDVPVSNIYELDLIEDNAAAGGKLLGLPNTGDELDPPPENDPHVTFTIPVQKGIPYRCWIHMKVGTPKGKSQANMVWAQFSDAVDQTNQEILAPESPSYLTARGPQQKGWTWVSCENPAVAPDGRIFFSITGQATVRLQAGMEGVGYDQFVLSPAHYLETAPIEAIVQK